MRRLATLAFPLPAHGSSGVKTPSPSVAPSRNRNRLKSSASDSGPQLSASTPRRRARDGAR
jgi:hypothetical protein